MWLQNQSDWKAMLQKYPVSFSVHPSVTQESVICEHIRWSSSQWRTNYELSRNRTGNMGATLIFIGRKIYEQPTRRTEETDTHALGTHRRFQTERKTATSSKNDRGDTRSYCWFGRINWRVSRKQTTPRLNQCRGQSPRQKLCTCY